MKFFLARMTLVSALIFFFLTAIKAQPDYTFKNAILVSGASLQPGAKYKFSNVKPGVDAFVTIIAQTGGTRLADIDNNTTGFDEALQPSVNIEKNSAGYVEFRVDFADAGTGASIVQSSVPVTSINVDGAIYGDGVLYEQDQIQFFPGNYDFSVTGGKLEVTLPDGWVSIKNISGLGYSLMDTVAKDVMATVINKNISGFLLRIGGKNTSPTISEVRLRSVYFKSFTYGKLTTLPNRTMLSLSGTKKQNAVELKGTLSASHSYDKLIIERAVSQNVFGCIGKLDITGTATAEFSFNFLDTKPETGINYYRIRLIATNSNIQEISNTLVVKMDNNRKELEVVNTILQGNNPVLAIISPEDNDADFQVADFSGRIINHTKAKLNTGFNNISLAGLNAAKNYFVLVIRTKDKAISRMIMVQ